MLKKEYVFVFVIIGLGIAYAILSIFVFLTRGKWFRVLNKRIALGTMIITFIALLSSGSSAYAQEEPTPSPTPLYGIPEVTPSVPPPTIAPYSVTSMTTPETTPPVVPPYSVPRITGDVDSNGKVDIIDALLISQHYVGLNPPNFNESVADVDCINDIDIIDALRVSQKYVGLIDEFTCDE